MKNNQPKSDPRFTEHLTKERLIRLPEVIRSVGYKKSNIYKLINEGKFPKPIKIGPRFSAWKESEIQTWIKDITNQSEV